MALYVLVFMGTNPVGAPLVGWVAEVFGPRTSIWLGGAISLVVAGIALVARLRMAGGRIRLRMAPRPAFYVDVAPAWQGDGHGVREAARLSSRGFHPVAANRRARSDRSGADLSRVDG
jgi:hypothetical protein